MLDRHPCVAFICIAILSWSLAPDALRSEEFPGQLTPEQSREKLRLADPQLTIELVSSEPAINSPVAMTWDAAGRMYVVEMNDYPTAETGGKIKQLQDCNGDGLYETVCTFADGLKFPNGALAWNGGLLVTCAPDILFLKDTDGDGHADERRVILTGFVEGNQQLRVNGLYWGLDNWVYGANGRSGGEVRRPADPPAKAISIRRHDFRFRPESGEFEAIAGFSQFGLGRDDFNHRFLSWNTVPFRHAVVEEQDLNRNPYLTSGNSIALIADPSDTGRIYPISSPPRTFNRERTDYFNASCGSAVFRGEGLGTNYQGNAFVGEPLTNLVHRKILEPQGATFVARRGEQQQEFLASEDSWFHPVNLAMGPDGCLYLADFYREWIEHPQFVQEALRKNVDFRSGNQYGRIWRIRRKDFVPRKPQDDFAKLSAAELAQQLNTGNAWSRDAAQRLLVERQDSRAVPILEQLVVQGSIPATRAQALWTLSGLSSLRPEYVARALKDNSAAVREQGIVLYRRQSTSFTMLAEQVLSLSDDKDLRVRFQVALAAGDLDSSRAISTLSKISAQDCENEWSRLAVLSGLGNSAWPFLQALTKEHPEFLKTPSPVQQGFIRDVAGIIGARQQDVEIAELCGLIGKNSVDAEGGAIALLSGLADGLARRSRSLDRILDRPSSALEPHLPAIKRLISSAKLSAVDRHATESKRLLAFRLLVQIHSSDARELILTLLASEESQAIQAAAAAGLADLGDVELAQQLLERWATYRINTRRELISALLRRAVLAEVLLDALEQGTISSTEVDITAREGLSRIPNAELQTRAATLLRPQENTDRDAVVMTYQPTLTLNGDSEKGAVLFGKDCLGCHQMKGKGARVGPDLSGIASRPKAALLVDILNPSKEVSPDFLSYVVVTKQGQIFSGLLSSDTATAVRIRRIQEAEDTVLRTEIEELRPANKSIMPEGFEQKFTPQDLAHLLEFLQRPVPLSTTPESR